MIKKGEIYSWGKWEKDVFTPIEQEIIEALVLYNPNFSKYFLLYTFSFDTSLVVVLTQKDELNNEQPISFIIVSLQGPELNYPSMEKQSYVVYKAMKHSRPYPLKNHCIIFVPHPNVRSFLAQQELGERRSNWMTRLQEYDIDVKPVHTIKGHGISKLVEKAVHAQEEEEELAGWQQEIEM